MVPPAPPSLPSRSADPALRPLVAALGKCERILEKALTKVERKGGLMRLGRRGLQGAGLTVTPHVRLIVSMEAHGDQPQLGKVLIVHPSSCPIHRLQARPSDAPEVPHV